MNLSDVLPEKWEKVTALREKEYYNESLKLLRAKKTGLELCAGCPLFRIDVDGAFIFFRCVFITKCIKQYPRIIDGSNFK